MRRFWALIATTGLGLALLLGGPSDAWAWRGGGWRGGGWHGGGWRGGWGWNRGWRGGWWPAYAGLGLGWAATSPYWDYGWDWDYGWPYDSYYGPTYAYGYSGYPGYYGAYAAGAAPVVTGRSVAAGSLGGHCSTPVKACLLNHPFYLGGGCSCRVPGGRAHGTVTP